MRALNPPRFLAGLCSCILACLAGVCSASAADAPPGRYVLEHDAGLLVLQRGRGAELRFDIDTVGGNCHTCRVKGTLVGQRGLADPMGDDVGPPRCEIRFSSSESGRAVRVEPADTEDCRAFCGARATFDGTYRTPPPACTNSARQARRDEFSKLYGRGQFREAADVLAPLETQCPAFIDPVTLDRVRNDLALAQFHAGDAAGCLKTLGRTRAARAIGEDALRERLPPCDFDNYIGVARATWHNLKVCKVR